MNGLQKIVSSATHVRQMGNENSSKPMFFSGTSSRIVPNQVPNSTVLSAITDMKVVDTVEGA
jgi:2-keto-4-pentenoate hydratase/2-oxohepta-3-ene-1,7-dioic acid hydratase in catechol pathway